MKRKLLLAMMAAMICISASAQTTVNTTDDEDNNTTSANESYTAPYLEIGMATSGNGFNDLLVYPNPVVSSTRIALDQVPGSNVFVDIVDLNGVVNRTFQYSPGSYQLDVDMSNLPTGIYSVRVSGRDIGYHNLKIVKE